MTQSLPTLAVLSTDPRPFPAALGQVIYERDTRRFYIFENRESSLGGSSWFELESTFADGFLTPDMVSADASVRQFRASLLSILGDCRRLWIPGEDDTTTSVDKTRNQATLTHNATLVGRLHALGRGWYVDFDGSTNYSAFPDANDLSFGNASADEAFSVVMLVNITNTANNRSLFGKYLTNGREYWAYIATNDTLQWQIYDETADGAEALSTNAAVPQDAWTLIVLTYDGSEDSDGMVAYVDGLPVAVTRTSDVGATYTAMANTTTLLGIGSARGNSASAPFQGGIAAFALTAKALSADECWLLRDLFDGQYDFLG